MTRQSQIVYRKFSQMPILLNQNLAFPDPSLADAEGLVAIGGDLGTERLLAAYRAGIFPWTVDPITWWSPDPRAIFELDGFHVSQSLARVIRQGRFEVTIDQSFRAVMEGCATPTPGRGGAWITEEFIEAYTRLHRQGHAHSVECRLQANWWAGFMACPSAACSRANPCSTASAALPKLRSITWPGICAGAASPCLTSRW